MEAIRWELTTVELSVKYGIHSTRIIGCKKTAIAIMASGFCDASFSEPQVSAGDVEKLHAKIGQLVVERVFLVDAPSLILGTEGKKR